MAAAPQSPRPNDYFFDTTPNGRVIAGCHTHINTVAGMPVQRDPAVPAIRRADSDFASPMGTIVTYAVADSNATTDSVTPYSSIQATKAWYSESPALRSHPDIVHCVKAAALESVSPVYGNDVVPIMTEVDARVHYGVHWVANAECLHLDRAQHIEETLAHVDLATATKKKLAGVVGYIKRYLQQSAVIRELQVLDPTVPVEEVAARQLAMRMELEKRGGAGRMRAPADSECPAKYSGKAVIRQRLVPAKKEAGGVVARSPTAAATPTSDEKDGGWIEVVPRRQRQQKRGGEKGAGRGRQRQRDGPPRS